MTMQFLPFQYLTIDKFIDYLLELHSQELDDKIKDILGIDENIYNVTLRNNNKVINKYFLSKGMIFLNDDNPVRYIRIYIDRDLQLKLSHLYNATEDIISNTDLLDLMITHFILSTKSNCQHFYQHSQYSKENYKENYKQLHIYDDTWKKFKKTCTTRNMTIKEGFATAIYNYINDRKSQTRSPRSQDEEIRNRNCQRENS